MLLVVGFVMGTAEIVSGLGLAGVLWVLKIISKLERQTDDMHAWHRPDQNGRQTWKDQGPLLERIDRLVERQDRLIELLELQLRKVEP